MAAVQLFDLRFTGQAVDSDNAVPANILSKALLELQKIVHFIGMQQNGRNVAVRARIPSDIQKRFVVKALAAKPGSYETPCFISSDHTPDLISNDDIHKARQQVKIFFESISEGPDAVKKVIPDPTYRRMMIDAVLAMIPPDGSGVDLNIKASDGLWFDSKISRDGLEAARTIELSGTSLGVITGKLDKIDFGKNQIDIILAQTGRRVICTYDPAMEPLLLSHPRELVQVLGQIERNEKNEPLAVTDVQDIVDIDASPITIDVIEAENFSLRALIPFQVEPNFDESEALYIYSLPNLEINSFASTRRELVEGLSEEVAFLWEKFAQADDSKLSAKAVRLKARLRDTFKETRHAS